ncbi:MAG: two pore domain potassium channel family protein, partial [Acidimicrobiales bacterium]
TNLTDLAADLTSVKEAHHFYPVLFYFRFPEPRYSVSRISLVALDAASLITSALDAERYGWLKESASLTQLQRVSIMLVTTLEDAFLAGGVPDSDEPPTRQALECWRRRYLAGVRRLGQAGIQTTPDELAGAEAYIGLRTHWDRYVTALAPSMAYSMDEIDPAGVRPEVEEHGSVSRMFL